MFVPSVHSLGADEAESTSGSGGQKSGGVQLSEQDARDLLSLASSGTAALFASGTGKIAERQAAYQQGIAAQQASVQAAKDAKNAAKTPKLGAAEARAKTKKELAEAN
ncbi:MAG: hypothetical protein EBS90_11490, partial [Betaproteobacteria bacterium]|nr:hypothetical protein [Betaproteobacteria bacterium]